MAIVCTLSSPAFTAPNLLLTLLSSSQRPHSDLAHSRSTDRLRFPPSLTRLQPQWQRQQQQQQWRELSLCLPRHWQQLLSRPAGVVASRSRPLCRRAPSALPPLLQPHRRGSGRLQAQEPAHRERVSERGSECGSE